MIYERRTLNGDRVETIKIPLETPPEMVEKYSQDGYTEVFEHYLVLYKPRIPQEEAVKYKESIEKLASLDLSTALKADLVAAVAEAISNKPLITEGTKEINNEPMVIGK
jgi:hypothetical protein